MGTEPMTFKPGQVVYTSELSSVQAITAGDGQWFTIKYVTTGNLDDWSETHEVAV